MNIKLELPQLTDLKPRLTVIGVGGAGCNALNNMIAAGLTGVDFVAANTDAQTLEASSAEHRIQLGMNLTEGLGAGANPEIGAAAAEEAFDEIKSQLSGSHMCFLAAGMGGGTGTGAISVIARASRELGILTVGVVTKPFQFEGSRRMRMAEAGIAELRENVDTLIVIPNQNLFRVANEKTTFAEAFLLADQVLYSGVACIVDLIVKEGLINLDFADVRAVMSNMGTAMMGTGEGTGERRAIMAAEEAIANPLLDDVSLQGARGLLLSITGGPNLTLYEVDEAASRVRKEVDPEANIIVGATFDDTMEDRVRVSIVASGLVSKGAKPGISTSPPSPSPSQKPRSEAVTEPSAAKSSAPVPPAGPSSPPQQPGAAAKASTAAETKSGERGPLADAPASGASGKEAGQKPAPARSAPPPPPPASGAKPPQHSSDKAGAIPGLPTGAASTHRDGPAPPPLNGPGPGGNSRDGRDGRSSAEAGSGEGSRSSSHGPKPQVGPGNDSVIWNGPEGVTIEAGGDPLRDRGAARPAGPPPPPIPAAREPDHGREFHPRQTEEIHRRAHIPQVDDFPEVGRRDYYAKRGQDDYERTPRDHGADERQKPGLFQRLTGFGRRQDDSHAAGATGKAESVTERDNYQRDAYRNRTSGGQREHERDIDENAQDAELPVFFNREQGRG